MKTRSKARQEANAAIALAMLASILQPLVDSGYMGAAEVGRLAQTCQEMNQATLKDDIWASFCQREYPNTRHFSPSLLERKGYRWFYMRWSCPLSKRRAPASLLGPPSCTLNQLFFFVDIKYNGCPICQDTFVASRVAPFLMDNGSAKVTLRKPVILGKIEWNYTEGDMRHYQASEQAVALPVKCNDFDESKLSVTIHVFRDSSSSTGLCLTPVFDSKECYHYMGPSPRAHPLVDGGESITPETKVDFTKEQPQSFVFFNYRNTNDMKMLPLRDSAKTSLILQRLPCPVFFGARVDLRVSEGGNLAIIGYGIEAVQSSTHGVRSRFNSQEESAKHGVTLLHILSELREM